MDYVPSMSLILFVSEQVLLLLSLTLFGTQQTNHPETSQVHTQNKFKALKYNKTHLSHRRVWHVNRAAHQFNLL